MWCLSLCLRRWRGLRLAKCTRKLAAHGERDDGKYSCGANTNEHERPPVKVRAAAVAASATATTIASTGVAGTARAPSVGAIAREVVIERTCTPVATPTPKP